MKLQKIVYSELTGKQQEIYNFQKLAAQLADYGFNCIKLADDWQGADFLAYHRDGENTLKVQLKGRLTIDKKYLERGLFIAFPVQDAWYVIEHDRLVELIRMNTKWLESSSWVSQGIYHSHSPSNQLTAALAEFKL